MTNQDSKYDSLINTLRNSKPVAENAGMLTEKIMQSVQGIRAIRQNRILIWMRPLLTSAALVFLGLLFYQTSIVENIRYNDNPVKPIKFALVKKDYFEYIPSGESAGNTILLSEYKCYMRQNRLENKALKEIYSKYLTKIQKNKIQ